MVKTCTNCKYDREGIPDMHCHGCYNHSKHEPMSQTNADRIRSMSDEELAKENLYFISEGALKEGFHYTGLDGRYYKTGEEAFMANMRWLKSEVKE